MKEIDELQRIIEASCSCRCCNHRGGEPYKCLRCHALALLPGLREKFEAAESQLAEKDARIAAQREAILWAYQLAGVAGEPSEHLDNLSAIGRGLVPPNEWGVAGERLIVNICKIGNAIDILRPWAAMLPEYAGNLGSEKVMIIVDDVRDLAKLYAALAAPESGKSE